MGCFVSASVGVKGWDSRLRDDDSPAAQGAVVETTVGLGGVVEAEGLGLDVDGAGAGQVEDLEQL